MKKTIFWYLTLCALLVTASVNGWDLWYRIAVASNALVVLIDIVERARARKR